MIWYNSGNSRRLDKASYQTQAGGRLTMCPLRNDKIASHMTHSKYELSALEERARQWRCEADRATSETMARICLAEAHLCDWLVQQSRSMPILREAVHAVDC
jgi:hypothetical protein